MTIYILYRVIKHGGGHGEGSVECEVRFHEHVFKKDDEAQEYFNKQEKWIKYKIQEFTII